MSSPADLSTLTYAQIGSLTQANVTAFTPAQIATLTYEQVKYMLGRLNTLAVANSPVTSLNNIFSYFTGPQFQQLNPDVFSRIINSGTFEKFTTMQKVTITDEQFLKNFNLLLFMLIDFSYFPAKLLGLIPGAWAEQINRDKLSNEQKEALGPVPSNSFSLSENNKMLDSVGNIISDNTLSVEEATSKLTPGQLNALSDYLKFEFPYDSKAARYYTFNDILFQLYRPTPITLSRFLPQQISIFPVSFVKYISPKYMSAFSMDQLKAFTPDQIKAFIPDQLDAFNTAKDPLSLWQKIINWIKSLFGIKSSFDGSRSYLLLLIVPVVVTIYINRKKIFRKRK